MYECESCISRLNDTIEKYYKRNRSLIDTVSKCEYSMQKVFRLITKAATHCGCISFSAQKQPSGLEDDVPTLISGELCESCRYEIEKNISQMFFYTVSLCSLLNIDAEMLIETENDRVRTLGRYNLR